MVRKVFVDDLFESLDELGIELIVGEPRSSREFDRGLDPGQHVDFPSRELCHDTSARTDSRLEGMKTHLDRFDRLDRFPTLEDFQNLRHGRPGQPSFRRQSFRPDTCPPRLSNESLSCDTLTGMSCVRERT